MTEFVNSATFYQYRGEQYRMLSVSNTYARVLIDPDAAADRFPDALEFGTYHDGHWVKLPLGSIEAAFDRRVSGRWQGVPVIVSQLYTTGPAVGLVRVVYDGASPDEANASGLRGDQYNGWQKAVSPAEVEIVGVDVVKRAGFGSV